MDVALGMIRTAAVSFDHLTNSEHWDRFLSYVQSNLDEARKERARVLSLCGGAVGDALTHMQFHYQYHDGYVKALEEMIALPSQMMQGYQDVKQSEVFTPPQAGAESSTTK